MTLAKKAGDMDDEVDRSHAVRVISIYATDWRYRGEARQGPEVALPLGPRLEEFHYLFQDQLPRPLHDVRIAPNDLRRTVDDGVIDQLDLHHARVWLFYLPSDQVVAALDLVFESLPLDVDARLTTSVLEHCAFDQFCIEDRRLGEYVAELAKREGCTPISENTAGVPTAESAAGLPPERHQIVFAPRTETGLLTDDQLKPILYRSEAPFRPEFIDLREPEGLNPPHEVKLGRVTPYTSLLVGHNEYIENSVFLTAVQAVGTSARFRQIWHRTHAMVSDFRNRLQAQEVGQQSREGMEGLADELGNLELELSFSVETSSDLGLLIPALRSVSFHRELYAALELQDRADRVSRMFTRLDSSINSELTAIGIREAKQNDRRRTRWTVALNVLAVAAVPITVLLAFFGVSTTDLGNNPSIRDLHHFWPEYTVALALGLLPLIVWALTGLALYAKDHGAGRRSPGMRPPGAPTAPGAAAHAALPAA
jgi:hypothetical protein